MEVKIYNDYQALSAQVADDVIHLVKQNPEAVLCMASGDTPKLCCQLLVQKATSENIDFSNVTFIGLDEWVGIDATNEGSCRFFFEKNLLDPLRFRQSNVRLFNGLSDDLDGECERMDAFIKATGPIDLMIVGIGMNGHIGFNEPGVSFDLYAHVAELDKTTTSVGQKYFNTAIRLDRGITLGFKHLMESRKLILMANGAKKAGVIKKAVEDEVSNIFPATIIQSHSNAMVMVDKDAASQLQSSPSVAANS